MVGPIPTLSKARTLITLGAVEPATTVEEALDGAERDRGIRRGEVLHRYNALRVPGRNGIAAMTQILDRREAAARVPRSVLERRMLRLVASAGLPMPTPRFRVRLLDGRVVELDFAWVAWKLAVEVDGHGAHSARRARASDAARGNALGDVGWRLRRYTWEQVLREPSAVSASLRRALAAA
ncbi:MAG: DUF559 domain-containing protein [Actinomycetota bacterium]